MIHLKTFGKGLLRLSPFFVVAILIGGMFTDGPLYHIARVILAIGVILLVLVMIYLVGTFGDD